MITGGISFDELRKRRTERYLCRQCLWQTSDPEVAKQHITDMASAHQTHFIEDENATLAFYPALNREGRPETKAVVSTEEPEDKK